MSAEKNFGGESSTFPRVFWALFVVSIVASGLLARVLLALSMLLSVTFDVAMRDVCVC